MFVKRIMDLGGAILGVVLLLPVWIVIAVLVKASSRGPVLYRQERIGRDGRPFEILKFRSMRVGPPGRLITVSGDPRITPIGRVLRATKLDETPQFLNVIVGHMSLVGPRPEVARYVALYPEAARRKILSLRPGITDPATIAFRNEEAVLAAHADPVKAYETEILPAKIRAYVEYVDTRTLRGDLVIVGRTLGRVFVPGGIRDADSPRPL